MRRTLAGDSLLAALATRPADEDVRKEVEGFCRRVYPLTSSTWIYDEKVAKLAAALRRFLGVSA